MSSASIDFARLSLCDALDLAVLVEEEARDRYQELAQQLDQHRTPAAAAFFHRMVRVEELHRAKLAERRRRDFGAAPTRVDRQMLFDVEAPSYDVARAFMSVRQALLAALQAEQKAHAFFVAVLTAVADPSVRLLLEELRDEEVEHQALVAAELDRLPHEALEDAGDSGDPPVGL